MHADKDRTSVRHADGNADTRHKFLFFRSDPNLGPGSEVAVPLKDTANTHELRDAGRGDCADPGQHDSDNRGREEAVSAAALWF
jgi:hypothetical protein